MFVYHFRFTREPIQIRSVRFLRAQATGILIESLVILFWDLTVSELHFILQ